eukprot:16430570-Heterocapsa_arctica.AAC.1
MPDQNTRGPGQRASHQRNCKVYLILIHDGVKNYTKARSVLQVRLRAQRLHLQGSEGGEPGVPEAIAAAGQIESLHRAPEASSRLYARPCVE